MREAYATRRSNSAIDCRHQVGFARFTTPKADRAFPFPHSGDEGTRLSQIERLNRKNLRNARMARGEEQALLVQSWPERHDWTKLQPTKPPQAARRCASLTFFGSVNMSSRSEPAIRFNTSLVVSWILVLGL